LIATLEDELGHEAPQIIKSENAEAGLTCGDQPLGIPRGTSNTYKIVQVDDFTVTTRLIAGTHCHFVFAKV
jgi:hypothetical protein